MKSVAAKLLSLSAHTKQFSKPKTDHFRDEDYLVMLSEGVRADRSARPSEALRNYDKAFESNGFSLERAFIAGLSGKLDRLIPELVDFTISMTSRFQSVRAEDVYLNPASLPVLMHALKIHSKRDLQKELGIKTVSEKRLAMTSACKLATAFKSRKDFADRDQIINGMSRTLEGVVRDLTGRHLLESFVTAALECERVPYSLEADIKPLEGALYDHRPDFLSFVDGKPKAYIEVRRSTVDHSSLYAKEKAFSAINWKSRHPEMLAVLITEGNWSGAAVELVSKVYDYVIPVLEADRAADLIGRHVAGEVGIQRKRIRLEIENL